MAGKEICESLIDKLESGRSLSVREYEELILAGRGGDGRDVREYAAVKARAVRERIYGKDVFIRGIVEFTNYCRNNCYYCGIRSGNGNIRRYRLKEEEILSCCEQAHGTGIRTFVLQGGEDVWFSDEIMCGIIKSLKKEFPDSAVTLSLGERSRDSYKRMYDAGADRYLLRHETADRAHYRKLHPDYMSWENRMLSLLFLRDTGYDVGCGMMVGSPGQTVRDLAEDLKFIEIFRPDMCGTGPFIPHRDTPFRGEKPGTCEETVYLLSLIRLICPEVLLPATTALGTIDPAGREKGIRAGANVVMPNISPSRVRHDYELYDNKICMDDEPSDCRECLNLRIYSTGYRIVTDRGDVRKDVNGTVRRTSRG